MGPHLGIEFADYSVYNAWQISEFNVTRDCICEIETLIGKIQVIEVRGATSLDPNRSQLASHYKASVSSGLLKGEILSLRRRH